LAKGRREDVTFNIEEHIAVLKENDTNDWCKAVDRISWNGRPTTLDIRNRNMSDDSIRPKGISLSDEEADHLTDILLDRDYGSMEAIEVALKRKKSRFTVLKDFGNAFGDGKGNILRVIINDIK
jgi:hypothetical protein